MVKVIVTRTSDHEGVGDTPFEVPSIEVLFRLVDDANEMVIIHPVDEDGVRKLEVYDDYRE